MAQRFTGTIYTSGGKKLDGARVVLKSGSFSQGTTTDKNGTFNILTPNDIASSGSIITVSKENYILYSISNPQPTGLYSPPRTLINPIYGGLINLSNTFEAGKYLISSLNPKDQERLYWELFNIQEFVKNNQGPILDTIGTSRTSNYEIVIVASESQVPNYDREEFLENGDINTNWAGPPNTNTFKTPELIAKTLSEKRSNSLKTYINNFFKENGLTPPNITSDIRVGDLVYKEGDDIKNFIPDQYVRLEARLITATCEYTEISENLKSVDLTLIKPPNSTTITINAKEFPDRFGINKKLNNYYTINSSVSFIDAWGFIVYLKLLLFDQYILKNDNDLIKTKVDIKKVQEIFNRLSIEDSADIKGQLLGFINIWESRKKGKTKANENQKILENDTIEEILNYLLFDLENFDTTDMYIILIKRENTVIKLDNIGNNESFILNASAGNIVEQSVFEFKICNN
jgi:hypothetical protein